MWRQELITDVPHFKHKQERGFLDRFNIQITHLEGKMRVSVAQNVKVVNSNQILKTFFSAFTWIEADEHPLDGTGKTTIPMVWQDGKTKHIRQYVAMAMLYCLKRVE